MGLNQMFFRILVIASLPFAANAQVYGDTVGCAWLAGTPPATDNLYLYDGATIQRMETRCTVTGSQQVGSGGILLTADCTGEGDTWEDYYILSTTADENVLFIQRGDTSAPSTEIKVCDIK
jgi:hypothetical protein